MPRYKFRNMMTTRPLDVETGNAFAIKVVAVAGYANDWAAYMGPSDWSDQDVAEGGDKLSKEQAEPLFLVLRNSGRYYRG